MVEDVFICEMKKKLFQTSAFVIFIIINKLIVLIILDKAKPCTKWHDWSNSKLDGFLYWLGPLVVD